MTRIKLEAKAIADCGGVGTQVSAKGGREPAVFAAYGWPFTLSDVEILERLLALNHERAEK